MDPITLTIGLLGIVFGTVTLVLRFINPEKLGKLEAMKKIFGEKAGNIVHLVSYSLVPIAFGLVLIFDSFQKQ